MSPWGIVLRAEPKDGWLRLFERPPAEAKCYICVTCFGCSAAVLFFSIPVPQPSPKASFFIWGCIHMLYPHFQRQQGAEILRETDPSKSDAR